MGPLVTTFPPFQTADPSTFESCEKLHEFLRQSEPALLESKVREQALQVEKQPSLLPVFETGESAPLPRLGSKSGDREVSRFGASYLTTCQVCSAISLI